MTTTPVKAIRAKCLECSNGHVSEIRDCAVGEKCPLYPYRMGRNPARTGIGNKTPPFLKKPVSTHDLPDETAAEG